MNNKERVAVITGATGGLGSALAHRLASSYKLALLDIDSSRLDALVRALNLSDNDLETCLVNLLDLQAARASAEAIQARFGRIDILLHVVGGWTGGKSLLEVPPGDMVFMLNQHIWTSLNGIQAFVPFLKKNQWGRVIMITSPYGVHPLALGGPYAAAKAGQEALMMTLAHELEGSGVTANVLQAKTIDVKGVKVSAPSAENASWTTPEEMTEAILYLISESAGTVNGTRIPMFGAD